MGRGSQKRSSQSKSKPNKPAQPYKTHRSYGAPMKITEINRVASISYASWLEIYVEKVYPPNTSQAEGWNVYQFIFSNGKDETVSATSTHTNGMIWSEKLKAGNIYAIQGNIQIQKNHPKYNPIDKPRLCKSEFKLFLNLFIDIKKTGTFTPKPAKTIEWVQEMLQEDESFACSLENVDLLDGRLYRYMGCEMCTTKIRKSYHGMFLCTSTTCPYSAEMTNRKNYMTAINLTFEDDTGILEDVKGFNTFLIRLLKKESKEFEDDVKAQDALQNLFGATVNIDLIVTKVNQPDPFLPLSTWRIVCTACTIVSDPIRHRPISSNILGPSNQNVQKIVTHHDSNLAGPSNLSVQRFKPLTRTPLALSEIKLDTSERPLGIKRRPVIYPMTTDPKGLALIINNYELPERVEGRFREGSEVDFRNLKAILHLLGHSVFEYGFWDVKSSDLQSIISRFQKELVDKEVNSCIVVIMSHGTSNQIEMVDGKYINLYNDLVYKFSDDFFPGFVGKPKIFCVQACQGFVDYEFYMRPSNVSISDTLVIQSSLPGHYSYRNSNYGTPFIYCVIEMLMKLARGNEIRDILASVQMEMKSINPEQICTWQSFLFADFYFIPPTVCVDSLGLNDLTLGVLDSWPSTPL